MTRVLIDTNVLIYAVDQNNPAKQEQAIRVLEKLVAAGNAVLSIQALSEFANASLKRLRPPMPPEVTVAQVARLARSCPILDLTANIVIEATRAVRDHRLAYYDAQLWATARLNQVPVIFSEDFTAGASLEGIRFIDPFAQGFDLNQWA
jgi:predicted nucleic acid-binding protein